MEIRWLGEVELTFNPSFYPSPVRISSLPWQYVAEGKTVQSTGEDTVCPWQEDSHPLFLPFPCPYAHGELSTLPLSGFPWREDSQSFPIVAGQR